jgi:CRISPR/Cas system CSM-associated protein Csm3 (group 7 of RAMP superfamily)
MTTTSTTTPLSPRPNADHTIRFEGRITTPTGFRVSAPHVKEAGQMPRLSGRLYIPGSGIRGVLRQNAALWLFERMREQGKTVDLDAWYLATLGGIKSAKSDEEKKTESAGDQAEYFMAQRYKAVNPVIALFGSGDPFTAGAAAIQHGLDDGEVPMVPDLHQVVRRENVFGPNAQGVRFLSNDEIQSWEDRRAAAVSEARSVRASKTEFAKALKEKRELPTTKIQPRAHVDVRHIGTEPFETIPAGASFGHKMVLSQVTMAEIGFFLEALARFSENPQLGSMSAKGIGSVEMRYDIKRRVGRGFNATWEKIDTITIDAEGITKPTSKFLLDALAQNTAALDIYDHRAEIGKEAMPAGKRGRPPIKPVADAAE